MLVVDQSTRRWKEVAALGFRETTWTRREAKVALLRQGRVPRCPDSQPFLWTRKDFTLSRLLWRPRTALTPDI